MCIHTHKHTYVDIYKHTRVHTAFPFGDVPCVAHVCWGRKTSLPVFLHQNLLFFSLGLWSYFCFTKIAPLRAVFLIGGIISP